MRYDGDFARRSWDRVTGGIVGADAELSALRMDFIETFETGSNGRKLIKSLVESLAATSWSWPWFEKWECEFERRNIWPEFWPQLQPDEDEFEYYDAPTLMEFRQREIAPLIFTTSMSLAYSFMHVSKSNPKQTWRFICLDQVEQCVADERAVSISRDGLNELPPFFPGDRTTLAKERPLLPPL